MSTKHNQKNIQLAVLLAFVVTGLIATTAYSSLFLTVNTDDGSVDSNWSLTPLVTDPIGDTTFEPWSDITKAWFGLNGPIPTEYYFRIEVGSDSIDPGGTAHVDLDCNLNGSFSDETIDKRINYWIGYDELGDPGGAMGAVFIMSPAGMLHWPSSLNIDTDDYAETSGKSYEIKIPASPLGLCATPPFGIRFLTNHGADVTNAASPPSYTYNIIDPEQGGTVVYSDSQELTTAIQVPPNAITETTTLVYTAVPATTTPSDFVFAGHAFDLEAYRNDLLLPTLTFNLPVTVTIHYSDTDVWGIDENELLLQTWNTTTNAWEDAACGGYDRHPTQNWLSAPICHLSQFALFGRQHKVYLPLTTG